MTLHLLLIIKRWIHWIMADAGFPPVTAVMDFERKQRFAKMTSWERPLSECSDMITSKAVIQVAACGSSVRSLNKPSCCLPIVFWFFLIYFLSFIIYAMKGVPAPTHTTVEPVAFPAFALYSAVIINLPFTGAWWLTFGDHKKWSAVEEQKRRSSWGQFYSLVRWKKKKKITECLMRMEFWGHSPKVVVCLLLFKIWSIVLRVPDISKNGAGNIKHFPLASACTNSLNTRYVTLV